GVRQHDNALRRGNDISLSVRPRPGWVFTRRSPPANPRLMHRCSTTTQPLPTCGTPAPAPPPASLRAPKSTPYPPAAPPRTEVASSTAGHASRAKPTPPPVAPLVPIWPLSIGRASRAKPASISTARASRAGPASAVIGCASLCQAGLRPLL
ncbi:Os10g0460000, partial [Oryza sativa Japonica Group]